jgi:glyoxylase-like metal-dependent hydrolase (beta-lactamase superfamily II)
MYMFDLGARPPRQAGAAPTVSPAYLIVHPKGSLLWEAGPIPDMFVGTKLSRANLRDNIKEWLSESTLKSRLAEIGYKAADITYLALSHYHDDHTANANDFVKSTWLVQKDEHAEMFGDRPPRNVFSWHVADFRTYRELKKSKTVLINNTDHDVFGDGTVVIKFTPANTPGGQALFVKLAKNGPVLLSGDLYHSYAEHAPPFEPTKSLTVNEQDYQDKLASRLAMEDFMKQTGTKLWIQHDFAFYTSLKKSPEYYE